MFDTCSAQDLSKVLGEFHVPMFAAQRTERGAPFRIMCINAAHERAAGLKASEVAGAALQDILLPEEAQAVQARYEACAATGQDMRYIETLTLPRGPVRWDTSLQYVSLKSGGERIIGTTMELNGKLSDPVIEDLRFHAAVAGYQLRNFVTVLDGAQAGEVFSAGASARFERLAALSRTVDKALLEIDAALERASPKAKEPGRQVDAVEKATLEKIAGRTLRALFHALD
jgi:hypothetical protein